MNGCLTPEVNVSFAYARQALRHWRLHGVPDVGGKRKKQKGIKVESNFLFSLSEHVSGRAMRHSLDLLFRFASRQNERQTREGASVKKRAFITNNSTTI
ncbi:hypothetical protein [Dysgonomonas alginatilytica]|uniref:hypothetical protein n=1 Tax=Dysgonomonas alginatilytica TaxID=1605892 RepID=UPI000D755180|nr:hypothetical protein [Dysgonomonas alginatilytica]